jgi:hypothetical protein
MRPQIILEDHVVPQLLTSAIEAYEISHITDKKGSGKNRLETYGLLWGYALPARVNTPPRLVGVVATVETSAERDINTVVPKYISLEMKKDFIREHWPQLELIGTFHSHPYDSLAEVKRHRGWRASKDVNDNGDGDYAAWPQFHEEICPEMDELAHLIVTITQLERKGTQPPERLSGSEQNTGYVITSGARKLWIKGYCTEKTDLYEDGENVVYQVQKNVLLQIPCLQQLFTDPCLRT